jgi:hypothetical protein
LEYNNFNSYEDNSEVMFGWRSRFRIENNLEKYTELKNKLAINQINKKRLQCLQILCVNKIKEIGIENEVMEMVPVVYESCLEKNKVYVLDKNECIYYWQKKYYD